jgi:hypothetical protein
VGLRRSAEYICHCSADKLRDGEKERKYPPPALVAGSSLPSLAIRPRFYALCLRETVPFCTIPQILFFHPRNPRHRFTLRSTLIAAPHPPLRPCCAANTKQIGNVC